MLIISIIDLFIVKSLKRVDINKYVKVIRTDADICVNCNYVKLISFLTLMSNYLYLQ